MTLRTKTCRLFAALFGTIPAITFSQTMVDISPIGGSSSASIISADGNVIGGGAVFPDQAGNTAFIYANGVVTNLGALSGDVSSGINGMSANGGVIIGDSVSASGNHQAFKYVNGAMTGLGTLGGATSNARAISLDGSVIVGSSAYSSFPQEHAFMYTNGVMTDLGTLGGTSSAATAVSANGSVIVGSSTLASNRARAFMYANGVMTNLGTLNSTTGAASSATAVSANGNVIIGSSTYSASPLNINRHAFMYTNGVMTDLGALGGASSSALGVSADGSVIIGTSSTASGLSHAFRYTNSTMIDLGTLGGNTATVAGISANGNVIIGSSETAAGNLHAFKYAAGTMTDLGTLGGTSSSALGVSADGSVIVGQSDTASGTTHAFAYSTRANKIIDIPNTYAAIAGNSYQLNSVLNLQNTLISNGLDYDCELFGQNNVCVAVGANYTNTNNLTATTTAANLRAAYRFDPQVRVGAFIDQSLANSMPNNYSLRNTQPMVGLFAAWSQTGNLLGPQLKASAAYGNQQATITRATLAYTEAGQGNSRFEAQGAQLEGGWGLGLNDDWIAQPLAGMRTTKVSRSGYSETNAIGFPITYNTVNQNTTTGYVGARLIGQVAPNLIVRASAGVEQDLSATMDNYSGNLYFFGNFSQAAPASQKTRAFGTLGADYLIDKTQRINITAMASQQQLNNSTAITGMVMYVVGF